MDVGQVKYLIVEPALTAIGLMTTAGLNLVTGTMLAESGGEYVQQLGGGPALGLWQMEPATEQDCWTNFLAFNPTMANQVQSMLSPGASTPQLVWNLMYAAAMCRIKYWRAVPPLPLYNDAAGMAEYHKANYNSALGAADVTKNTPLFATAIAAGVSS